MQWTSASSARRPWDCSKPNLGSVSALAGEKKYHVDFFGPVSTLARKKIWPHFGPVGALARKKKNRGTPTFLQVFMFSARPGFFRSSFFIFSVKKN